MDKRLGNDMRSEPVYLQLSRSGELSRRVQEAYRRLADCTLCPHHCHVDRVHDERGWCRAGKDPVLASWGPHFGEEEPLVGRHGSGTIFFSYCVMRCLFCQNYDISWDAGGDQYSPADLAGIMLDLQDQGCHNLNLVSPTHFVAPILDAVEIGAERGLRLPLVYNTGGYEDQETLRLLDGVVDIYMPDMKYARDAQARKYSGVVDYVSINQAAVKEMHRQVGDLVTSEDGIAVRGLIIRHLVLPENEADTDKVMSFIAREISPGSFVNLMDQYYPAYRSFDLPPLDRRITRAEMTRARQAASKAGLCRVIS